MSRRSRNEGSLPLIFIALGIGMVSIAGWVNGVPGDPKTARSELRLGPVSEECEAVCPDCGIPTQPGHEYVSQAGEVDWVLDPP